MQTIVLIMKRKSFAQSLMRLMAEEKDIQLFFQPDYADADMAIRGYSAKCALIEVAENEEYGMDYCLALCGWLQKETPECKLLLMCPESDTECVEAAIAAKRSNQISDFIFYDTSLEYLVSKLLSL